MRGLTEVEAWILEAPDGTIIPLGLTREVERLVIEKRLSSNFVGDRHQIIHETAEGREALRLHRIIKAMGVVFT